MINIGVIGCGNRIKRIIKLLLASKKDVYVKSIYDPSEENVNSFLMEFGKDTCVSSSYQEVSDDEEIDWIFIGSPNYAHKDQIVYSLRKNKNIFCEKPVAITIAELKDIKDEFKKVKKSFLISYPLRYSPHYKKVKKIIDEKEIGKIISFEFNETLSFEHGSFIMSDWRRLERFSGSHILEKCCHDFDVANFLLESLPTKVASFGGNNFFIEENVGIKDKINVVWEEFSKRYIGDPFFSEKDVVDNQVVILEYRNGARATFHTNCACMMPERRIYVCGSEGTLRTDVLKGFLQYKKVGSSETVMSIDDEFKGGHGSGDKFLVNELIYAMDNEDISYSTLDAGIKSAVVAIAAEEARKNSSVVNLEPIWQIFGY